MTSRRSRRQQASRQRQRIVPAALRDRCFNCLARGHFKATCREPARCLRCWRSRHRSFECRRPRRSAHRLDSSVSPSAPPQEQPQRVADQSQSPPQSAQQADPSLQRWGRRRRIGRRGVGKKCNDQSQKDGEPAASQIWAVSPEPPPPPVANELCFIDRVNDIDQWESVLEYLYIFVQIVGTRPEVEPQQALRAIAEAFNLEENTLEIQRIAPPEDFILRLPHHGTLRTVLQGDRTVITPSFELRLKPLSRRANADFGALYHKVQLELQGIPLHAWSTTMAADLLRRSVRWRASTQICRSDVI